MLPRSKTTILALCAAALVGCSQSQPREVAANECSSSASGHTSAPTTPGVQGESGISFGIGGKRTEIDNAGTGIGVNAYLWRATLDTLSFMPLVSVDPIGGAIITNWRQPSTAPRERFKANAYILNRLLRSDGIKVSLFHQVEQNGQWVDAGVTATTTGEFEDKILARARELRAPIAER